jgi:hypothetical protein
MIGASDFRGPMYAPTSGIDLKLYGLRVSNNIRYTSSGTGTAQTILGGGTLNDQFAYFTNDANCIAYLQMTDNPATALRDVTVRHGQVQAYDGFGAGVFMQCANSGGIPGNEIRDLQIQCGNGHGIGIAIGTTTETRIRNVKCTSGFQAIGAWNMGATYNIYVDDCLLQGYDSAYACFMHIVKGRNINCNAGRSTFRMIGSDSRWHDIFISPSGNSETLFKCLDGGTYGGGHFIRNVTADYEGYSISLAAFYAEAYNDVPKTTLDIDGADLGTIGSSGAVIMLKDTGLLNPGSHNIAEVSVRNIVASTPYAAFVDIDGPLWHGEVDGLYVAPPVLNHRQRWGTGTNVVVWDSKYLAAPRTSSWYNGAHALAVRSPVDGQFAEWRCATTGAYGTPIPPKWVGLNPLSLSPNGLAAYVLNHCYITVALN